MKRPVVDDYRRAGVTCAAIRPRLRDLMAGRLDELTARLAREHIPACRECTDAFGALLAQGVVDGDVPFRLPRHVPPLKELLTPARETPRFGVIWTSLQQSMGTSDRLARAWADARVAEIGRALDELMPSSAPPAASAPRTLRVRGAVRGPTPRAVDVTVVGPDEMPRATAQFDVEVAPAFTSDGTFVTRLRTGESAFLGDIAMCTIALPSISLSFSGLVEREDDDGTFVASIEADDVPWRPRPVPLRYASFTIVTP